MRKSLMFGLPVLVLAIGGAAALMLPPGDPIKSARARMARGDMRGAELYLRQAVHRHPQNPQAAFLLGEVDLALGNPEAAELELTRARTFGWDRAAIVLPLGQAYLQQRHFDAALRDFTVATAPAGGLADVLTIRAAALLSLGRNTEAQVASDEAEKAAPDRRETLLTAARIALARNDTPGAARRSAAILAKTPDDADALLIQAEIALRRGDAKSALSGAQAVLSRNQERLDARLMEARSLAALGKPKEARASIEQVLHSSPKSVSANYLGAMLGIQLGDYAGADASLTQISAVLGRLPRGFYFLAITKLGLGQTAQADEAIHKFLAENRDDLAGLKLLAFIDIARHNPAPALALLQQDPLAAHPDSDTLDLTGRAQTMSGDIKGAQTSFSAAVKLAPRDVTILNRLAAVQLSLGENEAAEADLQRSLTIEPGQRLAGEAVVQAALARGDIAAANDAIAQLRKTVGEAEEVGVLAAQVKIADLDLDGAERQLHDVLDRFPDSRPATLTMVRVDGLKNDSAAAEKRLQDWLARHPGDGGALEALLPALFADRKVDLAVKTAEAAHSAAPNDPVITAALASTFVRAHQTDRAVGLLDRASAGTNPQLDLLRSRVLAANGQMDQAEAAYRSTLRETPADLRTRIDLSSLLVHLKRYDDARTVLQDGLPLAPGNPVLLGAIVGADLREGGIKQALAAAATLRADPQNLPAANSLAGDALLASGDARRAADAFLAAYHATPSATLAVKAANALAAAGSLDQGIGILDAWVAGHADDTGALALLSSFDLRAHRTDDAGRHLEALVALNHADPATLNNLAWVKQQTGDATAARSIAERAYFLSPGPEIADTLGWILAQQGDRARAMPLLAQAVANPDPAGHASAAYHYGVVLKAAGREDEARTQLQSAVDSKADFPERAEAGRLLSTLH